MDRRLSPWPAFSSPKHVATLWHARGESNAGSGVAVRKFAGILKLASKRTSEPKRHQQPNDSIVPFDPDVRTGARGEFVRTSGSGLQPKQRKWRRNGPPARRGRGSVLAA